MRAILTAVAVLGLTTSAAADTILVPRDFDSIQKAVDAAAPFDTVVVSRGVYEENVVVGTANLTLVGAGAIVDGTLGAPPTTDGICIEVVVSDVTIRGFSFRNGLRHVNASGDRIQVLQCVSRDASEAGILIAGNDALVDRCRVLGSDGIGILVNGNNAVVKRCQVRQGVDSGISVLSLQGTVESCVVSNILIGIGVNASGDGLSVLRNRVTDCSSGISSIGVGATVQSNRVRHTVGAALFSDGDGAVLERNLVADCNAGLRCLGDGVRVLSNRVSGILGGSGLEVSGDDVTVQRNRVAGCITGAAFRIVSASVAGGGLVEENIAQDGGNYGLVLSTTSAVVRKLLVLRCGSGAFAGLAVDGTLNTVEDVIVKEADPTGVQVDGDDNTIRRCFVSDSGADGFRVLAGSNNSFEDCVSLRNGGEGLDNGGMGTTLDGGVYLQNRIDIANRTGDGATIVGGLASVDFGTGGVSTEPEVD